MKSDRITRETESFLYCNSNFWRATKFLSISGVDRYLPLYPNMDNLNSWTNQSPIEITLLSLMCNLSKINLPTQFKISIQKNFSWYYFFELSRRNRNSTCWGSNAEAGVMYVHWVCGAAIIRTDCRSAISPAPSRLTRNQRTRAAIPCLISSLLNYEIC